jgi:anti-sigma regulatory factor (Ser/Thr protein kinase)
VCLLLNDTPLPRYWSGEFDGRQRSPDVCVGELARPALSSPRGGWGFVQALHLDLPVHAGSPARARRQLRRWLAKIGWPPEDSEDLVLAVDEALANAVEHAYTGSGQQSRDADPQIELRVTDMAGPKGIHRAVVTVTDRGLWRTPAVSPSFRGRGLPMMRAFTDSLEINTTAVGTRVKMISRAVRVSGWRAGEVANA